MFKEEYFDEDIGDYVSVADLDHARDHLKGVLDALYSTGDVQRMESCLEEVCTELDVSTTPIGSGFKADLLEHMESQRSEIKLMKTRRV